MTNRTERLNPEHLNPIDRAEYDGAYELGRHAYQNSADEFTDNPYLPFAHLAAHHGWADGWTDARERAYGRHPTAR